MALNYSHSILGARMENGELVVKVIGIASFGKNSDRTVSSEIVVNLDPDTKELLSATFNSILDEQEEELMERAMETAGEMQAMARRRNE